MRDQQQLDEMRDDYRDAINNIACRVGDNARRRELWLVMRAVSNDKRFDLDVRLAVVAALLEDHRPLWG